MRIPSLFSHGVSGAPSVLSRQSHDRYVHTYGTGHRRNYTYIHFLFCIDAGSSKGPPGNPKASHDARKGTLLLLLLCVCVSILGGIRAAFSSGYSLAHQQSKAKQQREAERWHTHHSRQIQTSSRCRDTHMHTTTVTLVSARTYSSTSRSITSPIFTTSCTIRASPRASWFQTVLHLLLLRRRFGTDGNHARSLERKQNIEVQERRGSSASSSARIKTK